MCKLKWTISPDRNFKKQWKGNAKNNRVKEKRNVFDVCTYILNTVEERFGELEDKSI